MTTDRLQLRSYRLAFELERRIHHIDRFRIPVPYGLPLAAVGWWFGGAIAVVVVSRLPVAGVLLGVLPWPVRLFLVPVGVARALCAIGPDGRPAYERAVTRCRARVLHQQVVGFRRQRRQPVCRLADVCVAGDERGARLRPAVVRGAGPVLIGRPATGQKRGDRILLVAGEDRWLAEPHRLELAAGVRLEISCKRR